MTDQTTPDHAEFPEMIEAKSMAQIMAETDDTPAVTFDGKGYFDITMPNSNVYSVEVSRCTNPAETLVWVLHLAQKRWVTPIMLQQFAELAAEHHGFQIPWGV